MQPDPDFPKLCAYLAEQGVAPGHISMARVAARTDAGMIEDTSTTKTSRDTTSTASTGAQTGSGEMWAQARAKNAKSGDTAHQGGEEQAPSGDDPKALWQKARAQGAAA